MKYPLTTAAAAAALLLPATAMADWTVKVHVVTDEPVALEHRTSADQPWEPACNAPCDVSLPVADEFRFAETKDANPSKPFGLKTEKADGSGVITIQHQRTTKAVYQAAPFVIGGSVAMFVTGIVLATVGITKAHGTLADGSKEQTNAITGAGTLLIMGGLAGGYFGASSLVNNRYSDSSGDVRSLEPTQTNGQATPQRGIAIFVPIFSGRF